MASIALRTDILPLVDATISADPHQIIAVARPLLEQDGRAAELIGRIGMIAAHGDSEGHTILMLDAASILSRWIDELPLVLGEEQQSFARALPLLVQALVAAAPAVRAGNSAQNSYPEPFFPSDLSEGQTVSARMHDAIYGNDADMVERLLFGLYGSGADYRTMQIRSYDGISTTFENAGHPLMFAVRGTQLLDTVEWGDRVPNILHWLSPHLTVHSEEPTWVKTVRSFLSDPHHSLESYRIRLAFPKDENALPLRQLVLSNSDTPQICQGVYDALMNNGASSHAIGSVIALAATDLMQRVGDDDRDAFIRAAHGLLFASAVRLAFREIQDIEALPLLFTSAAFINALSKELEAQSNTAQKTATHSNILGGGLIAPALLDTLREQLDVRDLAGAYSTARRYLQLGYDARGLFATIALVSALADASNDMGHTWQVVQAAGEELISWPSTLSGTNIEGFVHVALRSAAFAQRNTLVNNV